ncbi:acetate kinase [Gallaecimonas sp. GXIMD4217]|uniref:acetate kinase n=1 Tax=Gallaecimonas sp. GXIMD4217 TaxID=3131927 RepID=UPI00311B3FE9
MSKLVLVLNCGSSSLKFAIVDGDSGQEQLSGLAECLGQMDARIKYKADGQKRQVALAENAGHGEALGFLVEHILAEFPELKKALVAVGHRVVHGGERFTGSVAIDDEVIKGIEACADLAPLHNPANLEGIRAAMAAFPALPQVAVFDTAFHQSMPPVAYTYALPYHLYRDHGIRRYGFHGTSHYFVSREAAQMLGKPVEELRLVSAHLGNGASVCAIKGGKSVDTSMGLTPLEGLVMGTRSGDLDPSIIFHLMDNLDHSAGEVKAMLNKASGLLGVSELTNDCRGIEEAAAEGHGGAMLALNLFCYRLAKYIASYAVPLKGLDGIIFTGGIGENSDVIRAQVLEHLAAFGFELDDEANLAARFGQAGIITKGQGPKALVVPTNEEGVIARDALAIAEEAGR